jgi:hypothetical protein
MPIKIKRLTKEEAEKIVEAKRAKVRRARERLIKRLEKEAGQMMQGQQGQDYMPSDASELDHADMIITAYLEDAVEGSFDELRDVLQHCAIDPRLVMVVAKKLLVED